MADKKLIQLLWDMFQRTASGDTAVRTISVTPQPAFGQVQMTGSAVQLSSNSLTNGVIITAKSSNTANIILGLAGVSTTEDGSGNGYILEPGSSISYACDNTNEIYAIGTSGDILSFAGS